MLRNATENQGRLIARIVWQLLKGERYESLADLTADVKAEAARLRIRVTADDINAAYSLIESNTALVGGARLPARGPEPEPAPLSAVDASAVLAAIRERIGAPAAPKTIPAAPRIKLRTADRVRALRIVAAEMAASIDRCETLESDAGALGVLPRESRDVASCDDARNAQGAPDGTP